MNYQIEESNGNFCVLYKYASKNGKTVVKEKCFETEQKRDDFLKDMKENDKNFLGVIVSECNESINGSSTSNHICSIINGCTGMNWKIEKDDGECSSFSVEDKDAKDYVGTMKDHIKNLIEKEFLGTVCDVSVRTDNIKTFIDICKCNKNINECEDGEKKFTINGSNVAATICKKAGEGTVGDEIGEEDRGIANTTMNEFFTAFGVMPQRLTSEESDGNVKISFSFEDMNDETIKKISDYLISSGFSGEEKLVESKTEGCVVQLSKTDGKTEIYGLFPTGSNAHDWMMQEASKIKEADSTVENGECDEHKIELKGYGTFQIIRINAVMPW